MMTLDEAMASAAAKIAGYVEQALLSGEALLRDHGATEDEVEAFMIDHRRQMETWAEDTLAEIRRTILSDWQAPSTKLH